MSVARCGMIVEKNLANCLLTSKSLAARPSAFGSTVQTSDVLRSPWKASYLSHVHLPTVSAPVFLYCGFGGGAGRPGIPRPRIIASIRARCSGGMLAIAPCSWAATRSMSAFEISL